jgi:hypothetical protein
MTPSDWQQRFLEVTAELSYLASVGIRTGDDVTEREGDLLDELDVLEITAEAMVRAGTASE